MADEEEETEEGEEEEGEMGRKGRALKGARSVETAQGRGLALCSLLQKEVFAG